MMGLPGGILVDRVVVNDSPAGLELANFARVPSRSFSNFSRSNFSSFAHRFSNFSSQIRKISLLKKGTSA